MKYNILNTRLIRFFLVIYFFAFVLNIYAGYFNRYESNIIAILLIFSIIKHVYENFYNKKEIKQFEIECEFNLPKELLIKFISFYIVASAFLLILFYNYESIYENNEFMFKHLLLIIILINFFNSVPLEKNLIFQDNKMIFIGNFFGCELDKKEIQEICRDDVYLIMKLKNGKTYKLKAPETYLRNRGKEKQLERLEKLIKEMERQWQISVPDCI